MAASLQASKEGLIKIDHLRRVKGWNKYDAAWCDQALTSQSVLKRFWQGKSVTHDSFVAICEVIGLEDWQTIALTPSQEVHDQEGASAGNRPQNINVAQHVPNNSGLVIGNVQGDVNS